MSKWLNLIKNDYKILVARLRRAPIDTVSRQVGLESLKNIFKSQKKYKRARIKHLDTLLKDLLVGQNYRLIPQLLHSIYNREEHIPLDILAFVNTETSKLSYFWPQIHLADEFITSSKTLLEYHDQSKDSFEKVFSLIDYMNFTELENSPIEPLKHETQNLSNETQKSIQSAQIAFNILLQNQNKISEKLLPFEVTYPLSPLGVPIPIQRRQNLVKTKIEYIKRTLRQYYRPVSMDEYKSLVEHLTNKSSIINPLFYKLNGRDIPGKTSGLLKHKSNASSLSRRKLPNETKIVEYIQTYARNALTSENLLVLNAITSHDLTDLNATKLLQKA